jgi:hypothetical protein
VCWRCSSPQSGSEGTRTSGTGTPAEQQKFVLKTTRKGGGLKGRRERLAALEQYAG